jgi:hypothetical protein
MQIKEIQTRKEILLSLELLNKVYEELPADYKAENIFSLIQEDYKMAVVFENEICVGFIAIRLTKKLFYGKIIEIEDFVIDNQKPTAEIGATMLDWVEQQAKIFSCQNIMANFATKKLQSQKIFAQEKFILDGFLFRKSITL